MRFLSVKAERCTGCSLCEQTCSETWFHQADRARSAIQVLCGDPAGHTIIVCDQCGDCIDICPTGAISRRANGVVRVDKALCVGCLSCVAFCDTWAMRTHRDEFYPFKCVACGKCAAACPEDVLSIEIDEATPLSETQRWAERVKA